MTTKLDHLSAQLKLALNDQLSAMNVALGEITIECKAENLITVCNKLRNHGELKFEQLIDLCGVDYSDYKDGAGFKNQAQGARYAVVGHLLSVSLNQRVRLRVFAQDDDFPVLPTLVDIWPVANWLSVKRLIYMALCLKIILICAVCSPIMVLLDILSAKTSR